MDSKRVEELADRLDKIEPHKVRGPLRNFLTIREAAKALREQAQTIENYEKVVEAQDEYRVQCENLEVERDTLRKRVTELESVLRDAPVHTVYRQQTHWAAEYLQWHTRAQKLLGEGGAAA